MLGATSIINQYSNVFGVQSGQSIEQFAQKLTATVKQGMPTDSVAFSPSAMMLQQFLNSDIQGSGSSGDIGELDLLGLTQLKQRGEMLASMLQLKMKNFESRLTSNVQGAGLPMQEMHLKNGDDGLSLLGEMPNKEAFQNALSGLQGEFTEISQLAGILNLLQQLGPDSAVSALAATAAQYAQQSSLDRSGKRDSDFVMHVAESGTSFSFE